MNALAQDFDAMPGDDEDELREALEMQRQLEYALSRVKERIQRLQKVVELRRELQKLDLPPELERVKRPRQRNKMKPHDIALLARDIIREAGRPMTRSELTEAIEARGVPLAGQDRVKNLGTILWRQKDLFVHIENKGYWPKGDPEPA